MEMQRDKSESLGYYNLARGLGITLIIFGHSVNPILSRTDISRPFQGAGTVLGGGIMAAFFMISGFGFYKRSPGKCFAIQKKMLLKPYAIVAAAVILTKLLLAFLKQRSFWNNGGELVFTYLFGLNAEGGGNIMGIPIESVSIFWFILALFGGWNLYNAIVQLKSVRLQRFLSAGCVVLGYFLTKLSKIWPFCLPMVLIAVGYLAVGEWIRKNHLLRKKIPLLFWIIMAAVVLLSAAFGQINMVACIWHLGLIDVASTFCVGFLLLRAYAHVMEHEWKGRIVSILEEVGFHSIWAVCLHAYEKYIFPWHRVYAMLPNRPMIAVVLSFCGRCIVMYFLYRILSYAEKKWKRKKRCVI